MANYTSLNTYDADTRIPEFKGLMQYGDGINSDPRYARSAYNMDTTGGILQPSGACVMLVPNMAGPIETLAVLHRRWYTGSVKDVLIAASGGVIYYMLPTATSWVPFLNANGLASTYGSNVWSWTAYEITPVVGADPVDVLYMTNTTDGLIRIRCDDTEQSATAISTPKKFGVIARHSDERLWGTGIATDPDMVMYSQPYLPENWTEDAVVAADDAGDIQQPSWDGDKFTALVKLGQQLIAFRKNSVWRILGMDPGEYVWKQQYGGGTEFPNTIAVDGDRVLMLGRDGVRMYDGLEVKNFYQDYCTDIFKAMSQTVLEQACGCMWKDSYYVAFPKASTSATNDCVLIFNTIDNTWLLRTDVAVAAFLPTDDYLYFTSDATPGRIYTWGADAWTSQIATTPTSWTGPWMDFNYKNVRKTGWKVYLTIEGISEGSISVSIETENEAKTKTVRYAASSDTVHAQVKRVCFHGKSGRRFRFVIASTGATAWRIVGGIQINTEIDPD